jgi:DUF4097 and DUF4098 domain-containing protein YvlB
VNFHARGLVFIALPILIGTGLAAQQPASKPDHSTWITVSEGKAASSTSLHIQTEGGKVRVEPGTEAVTTYAVRRSASPQYNHETLQEARLYNIKTYTQSGESWLVATRRNEVSERIPTELVIAVPRGVKSLELDTRGGQVEIGNIDCRVTIQSGGGPVELADIGGPVSVTSAGQDINIGSVEGDGRFYTGGGRITVREVQGNVDAWTGGGSIQLDSGLRDALLRADAGDVRVNLIRGELKVESGGGNLFLGDIGGRADVRTNGGNLRVHSAQGFVRAQTAGGNIELSSVPGAYAESGGGSISTTFVRSKGPFQESFLETAAGDISVYLPPDLSLTVRASVDHAGPYRIISNIPELKVESSGDEWEKSLLAEGKLNGGGPLLKIHASGGNIHIQRTAAVH